MKNNAWGFVRTIMLSLCLGCGAGSQDTRREARVTIGADALIINNDIVIAEYTVPVVPATVTVRCTLNGKVTACTRGAK